MTTLGLCVVLALFLADVVSLHHQAPKPSSRSSSPAAANASTDYSVNTTIVNGVAYAGAANGAVYALRISNGHLLWRHKIDPGASAALLVDSGIVYITAVISDVGPVSLYALRASNGVQLWRYRSSDAVRNLLVANGIAYVTSLSAEISIRSRSPLNLPRSQATERALKYCTAATHAVGSIYGLDEMHKYVAQVECTIQVERGKRMKNTKSPLAVLIKCTTIMLVKQQMRRFS